MVSNEARKNATKGYQTTIVLGRVVGINRILQTVEFVSGMGGNPQVPAMIMKGKAGVLGGSYDMPNIGDQCVIGFLGGNLSSPIILGFVESQVPEKAVVYDDNNNLLPDSVANVNAKLAHRTYHRHETGSFTLIDKLGNFMAKLFKKATKETDAAKANVSLEVDNAGNINIISYKSDGSTQAIKVTTDASGNFTMVLQGKVQVTATEVDLNCDGSDPMTGVVTGHTLCPFTGLSHIDFSTKVKAGK